MTKKKICIVFPDEWVSYSPTIINLAKELSFFFNVEVICFDNGRYDLTHLNNNKMYKIINIAFITPKNFSESNLYKAFKFIILLFMLRNYKNYDEIIAVDSVSLLPSTLLFKRVNFLSLEIQKDIYFRLSLKKRIKSLIIQSEEREDFMFNECNKRTTFYIQNSPIYLNNFPNKKIPSNNNCLKLIYMGHILPEHGICEIIETIRSGNNNYNLTLKGILPPDIHKALLEKYDTLIKKGKLILDDEYVDNDQLANYLSKFHIGICFYSRSIMENDYNYISSPSGKIFNYYNAGIPVIASDIIGLKSVRDFNAGILLKNATPENIHKAIDKILLRYEYYSDNARKAAEFFDFKTSAQSFIEYLSA